MYSLYIKWQINSCENPNNKGNYQTQKRIRRPDVIFDTVRLLIFDGYFHQYTIIILSNLDKGTTLLYKKIREALEFKGAIENF